MCLYFLNKILFCILNALCTENSSLNYIKKAYWLKIWLNVTLFIVYYTNTMSGKYWYEREFKYFVTHSAFYIGIRQRTEL